MRIVRAHTLPENSSYPDYGCERSPSCLDCSIAICKHDEPAYEIRTSRALRDKAIVAGRARGVGVPALTTKYGVSTRTIHRVLRDAREGRVSPTLEYDGGITITLEELSAKSLYRKRQPNPPLRQLD